MQVSATLKYARISPQKCRLVADAIRGKSVAGAKQILELMPKKGALLLKKVLDSAIANEAPKVRRFRASAKGRASPRQKRSSHITIQVADE